MAGHSKWANIQHRKGKQDAKRGKLFTKLIREITVAAKMGGGDISANPRLRLVVDKAYTANMSRDTIDRAIKRGAGGGDTNDMMELVYEGYAVGGVAVLVEALTDNRNRTVAEVRHAFTKWEGHLGTEGSVAFLFNKQGVLTYAPGQDEDQIMNIAVEAGAQDVVTHDDQSIDVITTPEDFIKVKNALVEAKLEPVQAEVMLVAINEVAVDDQETAEQILNLIEMLEDLDDVQNVYSNAAISDEIMNNLE